MTPFTRVAVFLAGFGVLGAEMVGPRLLAPAFGTSQLVWTYLIGTILASLTVGAWLGGRLADRGPSERGFGWILLVGGLLVMAIPFAVRPLLSGATRALSEERVFAYLLALLASSLAFAPPALVLGGAAPYAIRLAGFGRRDLGHVAGVLAALGALGSIAGTFATSLLLLPLFGSRSTLLGVGALIAAAGGAKALSRRHVVALLLAILAALSFEPGPIRLEAGQVYESESLYNYVQVQRNPDGRIGLLTNESLSYQSMWPADGILTGGVWDYLSVAPSFASDRDGVLRIALLGVAGGTVARQLAAAYGEERLEIDGIELDPLLIELGNRYFGLESIASLRIRIGDARAIFASLPGPYDAIVLDVFRGLYLPAHVVTQEFFEICQDRLVPGGVLAMNVAAPSGPGPLIGALVATLEETFTDVRLIELPSSRPITNLVLLASDEPLGSARLKRAPRALEGLVVDLRRADLPERYRRVLTDDHSPVELLTDLSLLEVALPPRDDE